MDDREDVLLLIRRQSDGLYYQSPKVRYRRTQRKEWQGQLRRAKHFWQRRDAENVLRQLTNRADGETYEIVPFALVEQSDV